MATRALATPSPVSANEWTDLLSSLERSLSEEQAASRRLRTLIAEVEAEGERQQRVLAG